MTGNFYRFLRVKINCYFASKGTIQKCRQTLKMAYACCLHSHVHKNDCMTEMMKYFLSMLEDTTGCLPYSLFEPVICICHSKTILFLCPMFPQLGCANYGSQSHSFSYKWNYYPTFKRPHYDLDTIFFLNRIKNTLKQRKQPWSL